MSATDLIAIYAAILSSLTLAYQINTTRKNFNVSLLPGIKPGESEVSVVALLRNTGNKSVFINSLSYVYAYRKSSWWEKIKFFTKYKRNPRFHNYVHCHFSELSDNPLPCEIHPGHCVQVWISVTHMNGIESRSDFFAVYAQDALGQNYYSDLLNVGHLTNQISTVRKSPVS